MEPWREELLEEMGAQEEEASCGSSFICPSVSTQCFPLDEPRKETGGKRAWEVMFVNISPVQTSRAREGQQSCHQGECMVNSAEEVK